MQTDTTKLNRKGHFKEIENPPPNEMKLTSNEGPVGPLIYQETKHGQKRQRVLL